MKIEINNLCKSFDKPVLNNINIKDNVNTLALIGRSGCGKSTLLRIIGGLLDSDSGEVLIDDKKAMDNYLYRKDIGFVFQHSGLFSHLDARNNITLPLIKVHNMPKIQAVNRADELLERFGLIEQALKKPSQLSGGQRQRIAIARAIAAKPKLLLLDEPTSALDPLYTSEVLSMVHELKTEGLSFIIATHEMGFAKHSCEKTAFIHEGNILEYGKSNLIMEQPNSPALQEFLQKLLLWR